MSTVAVVGAIVLGLLLAETRVSWRHERELRRLGAVCPPGDVYAAMAVLYPATFVAMMIEGLWRAGTEPVQAPDGPNWFASGVLLFAASKALKYWAIRSLGVRWTFRVFNVPSLPLVTSGPYRYLAHPNYVAVVGELVGAAMMCGAPIAGSVGLAAFGTALWLRVRFETTVLGAHRERRG